MLGKTRSAERLRNTDLAEVYNLLDTMAEDHGCAFPVLHHASKGSQKEKRNTDIGSGGGSQSRAVDCHLTLIDHELPDHVTVTTSIRAFKPCPPFVIRFEWPLWHYVPDVDPTKTAEHPTVTIDEILGLLPDHKVYRKEFVADTYNKYGGKVFLKTLNKMLDSAISNGQIKQSEKRFRNDKVFIERVSQ